MENTANTTATTVNNSATEQAQQPQTQHRRRESGNFRGQPLKGFNELDPTQFPQRPREERVPMWAQQLQKSIDLLSQEQEKLKAQIAALPSKAESYDDTKLSASVAEIKKICEDQFTKVRENQKHSHENLIAGLNDACTLLQKLHIELHPKTKRTLGWKIFHPVAAFKEWWAAAAEDHRQRKAAKLQAQLDALKQAQK